MTEKIYAAIEAQWESRAKAQGYRKGTKQYKDAEYEFFIGAMASLVAMGQNPPHNLEKFTEHEVNAKAMPPRWSIQMMRGMSITQGDYSLPTGSEIEEVQETLSEVQAKILSIRNEYDEHPKVVQGLGTASSYISKAIDYVTDGEKLIARIESETNA